MSSQQPNSSQGNLPENTDCYYYYYSNCTKRDTCPYRHEPLALNQEKVCTFWLQGTCAKPHCMFRHMKMEKNRSRIPCFWEAQPDGCKKPYCPFMHENPKDPYDPEMVAANIIPNPPTGGKIIVNKKKLDQLNFPNRTVLKPKPSIKDRLGIKVTDNVEIFEYSGGESEEESLRKGAMKTLDLRSRLSSKRKHSEGEDDYESDHREVRSVVKKVKKESKKAKKDKKERKEKKSKRHRRNSDEEDTDRDTLAKRIAEQRGKSSPGSHHIDRDPRDRDFRPGRSSTYEVTIKNRKAKDRKSSAKERQDSVLSVIDDVDALFKSSEPLPALDAASAAKSDDVMKELDELINC